MYRKHILLVAFRGTSAERLLKERSNWKKLLLPNHRIQDSAMLIDTLSKEKFDYVFCFGQKPLIKNKMETRIVFLHIPFEANITDYNSFCNKVFSVLETY